jgi:hypothetical protein
VGTVNVEDLLSQETADQLQAEVEIEPFGTFVIRGLTRGEVLAMRKAQDVDLALVERKMLVKALVEPRMSDAQLKKWQEVAPAGQMQPLVEAVEVLSGMREGEVRENIKQFRE